MKEENEGMKIENHVFGNWKEINHQTLEQDMAFRTFLEVYNEVHGSILITKTTLFLL